MRLRGTVWVLDANGVPGYPRILSIEVHDTLEHVPAWQELVFKRQIQESLPNQRLEFGPVSGA